MNTSAYESPRRVLGGVVKLSVGTTVVQGLSVVGQVLFALWLAPEDFGAWAVASSSLMLFSGLLNFGEVNGYLANPGRDYMETRSDIWKINSALLIGAGGVAGVYAIAGNTTVAVLVGLLAVNLPLLGQANLLYAAYVRQSRNRRLVLSMFAAAGGRIIVGVGVAWVWRSPIAFAVSMLVYSLVMIICLKGFAEDAPRSQAYRPTLKNRFALAVQSLSQTLPTQVDFFVVSLVAAPSLLGIYYLSYQATVAVSALVVGPLTKSVLAALSRMAPEDREVFAARLLRLLISGIGLGVCLIIGVLHLVADFLPDEWMTAAPTIAILLTSLPVRFQTPVAESLQMSKAMWWQSVRLNTIDTAGTAIAALAALMGDVASLAVCVVAWKIAYSAVRVWLCFVDTNWAGRAMIVLWPAALATTLMVGILLGGAWLLWIMLACAIACTVQLAYRSPARAIGK